ncbi:MAG TPA: tyrosine-type recombinase/integrase, partial [Thermoanaerobaculaceae bacterium]|nr:tyrosine-type recombinase/integrase [Thermoanaerobaculaceae bacterium]
MAERVHFTEARVRAFKPKPKRYDIYDDDARRLVVTVRPEGSRTFYLVKKVGGRVVRYRIARTDEISVEEARKQAAILGGQAALGKDPAEERRGLRAGPKLLEVWQAYLAQAKTPGARRKSIGHDEWRFARHLARWGARKLSEIRRADVVRLHATITATSGPYAANRAVALLSSLTGWWNRQVGAELQNPCRGVKRNHETSRERYLLPDEMRRWWAAVLSDPDQDTRELAALLLLLGVRRGNLQHARWEQLDLASSAWRIPAGEMKANREHLAPLPAPALGILRERHTRVREPAEGLIFPSRRHSGPISDPRHCLARIATAAGIADLRPHDLRRSYATWALEAGVDSAVVAHLLAHTDTTVSGIYRKVTFATALEASER